jgi:hypothetical protein
VAVLGSGVGHVGSIQETTMSVLVVSDLHLSANTRDEYRFKFMKRLRREATKHRALIVNGDITEEKDRHTSVLVNRIVDVFAAIAKETEIVFNMAITTTPTLINPFFAFMGHIPRVDWFHKISYVNTTVGNICVVPHTTNWKRDLSDQVRVARDCDYVLCHQTFAGTVLNGWAARW